MVSVLGNIQNEMIKAGKRSKSGNIPNIGK